MTIQKIIPWKLALRTLLPILLSLVLVQAGFAMPNTRQHQTTILATDVSGPITSDTTWTSANSPYIVLNDVTVDAGVTLTIDPDVVVKFNDDYDDLIVNGTLVADGTDASPIYFTSINDHTVGGNTGTGTPAGGDWSGLHLTASSSGSILNHVTVRYGGGRLATANLHVQTRDVTISNSTFAYGGATDHGIEFDNVLPATLTGNTFTDNGYDAIKTTLTNNSDSITLSNNHASGNRINGLSVQGTVSGTVTWAWAGGDTLPFVVGRPFASDVTVNAGATLSLAPGTVLKFYDNYNDLWVNGTLLADGTITDPILFTSFRDDTVGGDTNGDGSATSPAGANWSGLYVTPSSSGSILNDVTVRYGGGRSATANVHVQTRDVTISNSTFAYSGATAYGIFFDNVLPTALSNNTFTDNGYDAAGATLTDNGDSITLSNNHASGNRINGLTVHGTLSGTVTWDWEGGDTLPFVIGRYLASDLTVNAGSTLSLTPGTVLKFYDDYNDLWVNGTLLAAGTPIEPIVFTSVEDDTVGGDTNSDGDTGNPAGADWSGLYFTPSSNDSVLDHVTVRYGGGRSASANVHVQTPDVEIRNSTFANGNAYGLRAGMMVDGASPHLVGNIFQQNEVGIYAANGAQPTLMGNAIISNTDYGVYNATPSQLIDARENWWGDASGPYHATDNPGGTGDSVTDSVLFYPWIESLAWQAPPYDLFHGTETLAWCVFGQDTTSMTIKVTAISPTQTQTLGEGLDPDGTLDWDTTTVPDGRYELQIQLLDASSTAIDGLSREVLVLNNSALAWHAGVIGSNETWDAAHVHILRDDVTIPDGVQVTVAVSAVVKAVKGTQLTVEDGAILDAQGTAMSPIVFTSLADDTAGGDTNRDGTTTVPRPGDWYGIKTEGTGQFLATTDTYVRYFQRVHSGALTTNETWEADVVHRVTGEVVVPNGVRLTVSPGAVIKVDDAQGVTVQAGGEVIAQGILAKPIYVTSARDDTLGGDTNLDGNLTTPQPGDWRGFLTTGGRITLDHTLLRFGGGTANDVWSSSAAALATANGGTVHVADSRIQDPYFEGVIAWGSGEVIITSTVIAGADRGVNSDGTAVVRLTHSTLDDNRVGLYGHGGDLTVVNTIVANSLDYGVDNVLGSTIDIRTSNVWSTQGINYYHMADPTGTNGNLSVDPAFKNRPAGLYQLAYVSPMIDAADGTASPETDAMGAPRYDDPRVENTGIATGSGAYADIGAFEFVETAASPIDLVVTEIDAPSAVTAGEWITVSWTIRNDGTAPAIGPWHDTVALVQSPEHRPVRIEVDEIQVGDGVSLAPGDPYVASAYVRVPGAVVGEQYWQVATNARAEIFEGRFITNNLELATYPTMLDVPALVVDGGAVAGAFDQPGEPQWYRFLAEDGENVEITLDLAGSTGATELYLGTVYVPASDAYDARSPEWGLPDSHISIADAVSTTYYVMATGTGTGPFEIAVATYDFNLNSVSPAAGGNTGQVTLRINGEAIPVSSTVTLHHATVGDIPALATHWIDGNQIAATFDLTGVELGSTDVQVTYGATVRTLTEAFTITTGRGSDFWWHLSGPDVIRSGRPNDYTVTWGNQGDIDAPAHLLALHGSSLMTLQIPDTGEVIDNGFKLLAMVPDTAVPAIPPGATGSFRFTALSYGFGDFTLEARAIPLDDPSLSGEPVDWEAMRAEVKPDDLTNDQWNAFFDALITDLGSTWAEVGNALAEDALDALHEPDAPLYRRTSGVRLRIPLLHAMGRVAADLGWVDGMAPAPSGVGVILAEDSGQLRTFSIGMSGYEHHPYGSNLPGTALDLSNFNYMLGRNAQVFRQNRLQIHQPIGAPYAYSEANISTYVAEQAALAKEKDVLVYYFTGHGRAERDGSGSGSFVAATGGAYEYRQFLEDIKATQAKHVVVVIDACYSGSFIERVKKHLDLPEYLKDHITVLASSTSYQTSQESAGRGGLYTTALVSALKDLKNDKNGDGKVSLWEAHTALPKDMDSDQSRRQNPQWYGPDIILRDPVAQSKDSIEAKLASKAIVFMIRTLINGLSGGAEDPNDKVGVGYGTEGWVQAGEPLHYTIHFENIAPEGVDPALVWPAQDVVITDQLSLDLDWSTFELGHLGFNNTLVTVPPGKMTYEGTASVDSDPNTVMITATLDAETGLVTWRLHSTDDQTGQLPDDPLAGFLPANDETHAGEGFVTFSIMPRTGLTQGDAVYNQASIVFDVNAPIVTNIVTHTVDTERPTSTVAALSSTTEREAFTVTWSGSDHGGSGVAAYDVYVSDDGAPFVRWQSAITETEAIFTGNDGHTYGFYSVATDHVGHRQIRPETAQATTMVEAETRIYLPLVIRGF